MNAIMSDYQSSYPLWSTSMTLRPCKAWGGGGVCCLVDFANPIVSPFSGLSTLFLAKLIPATDNRWPQSVLRKKVGGFPHFSKAAANESLVSTKSVSEISTCQKKRNKSHCIIIRFTCVHPYAQRIMHVEHMDQEATDGRICGWIDL